MLYNHDPYDKDIDTNQSVGSSSSGNKMRPWGSPRQATESELLEMFQMSAFEISNEREAMRAHNVQTSEIGDDDESKRNEKTRVSVVAIVDKARELISKHWGPIVARNKFPFGSKGYEQVEIQIIDEAIIRHSCDSHSNCKELEIVGWKMIEKIYMNYLCWSFGAVITHPK